MDELDELDEFIEDNVAYKSLKVLWCSSAPESDLVSPSSSTTKRSTFAHKNYKGSSFGLSSNCQTTSSSDSALLLPSNTNIQVTSWLLSEGAPNFAKLPVFHSLPSSEIPTRLGSTMDELSVSKRQKVSSAANVEEGGCSVSALLAKIQEEKASVKKLAENIVKAAETV